MLGAHNTLVASFGPRRASQPQRGRWLEQMMKRTIYIALALISVAVLFHTVNTLVYPPLSRAYVYAKTLEARGETPPKPSGDIPKFDRPLGLREPVTHGAIASALMIVFCIVQLGKDQRKRKANIGAQDTLASSRS